MCTRCFETQSSPGCTCTRRSKFLTHSLSGQGKLGVSEIIIRYIGVSCNYPIYTTLLITKVLLASHLINCNIFKYLPPKREPEVVHSEGTGNELLKQKTDKEKTYQNTYVNCNKFKNLPSKQEPEVRHLRRNRK